MRLGDKVNKQDYWSALGRAFSFAMIMNGTDVDAQTAPPPPQPVPLDNYLNGVTQNKGIKAGTFSDADRQKLEALRTEYPNVQFVKLGQLDKYLTVSANHAAFNPARQELTMTLLSIAEYRNSLRNIYITPFASWPTHTVIAFNGTKPSADDICAFVPNSDVAEAKSIRMIRNAVGKDFRIDWDKAKQTPPSGTPEENLVSQQIIRLGTTKLPTQLFDARKLTCVVVDMPDSAAMRRLAEAPDGQWVTVITGGIFVVCVLAFRRGIVGEIGAWWANRKA